MLPPTDCKTVRDALQHKKFRNQDKKTLIEISKEIETDPRFSMCHVGFVVGNKNYIYKIEPKGIIHFMRTMDISRFEHMRRQ